jgi:hypothetical protein
MLRPTLRRHFSIVGESAMNRLSTLAVTIASLLMLGVTPLARNAVAQERAQQTEDVERVSAASRAFIAAIAASNGPGVGA